MSSQREKELRRLLYLKREVIKEAKKQVKAYSRELQEIQANKHNDYNNKSKVYRRK